jgi:hypothetical protein
MLDELLRKVEMPENLYSLEFVLCNSPLAFSHKFAESITALKAKMATLLSEEQEKIEAGLTDLDRTMAEYMAYARFQAQGKRSYSAEIKECADEFEDHRHRSSRMAEEQHLWQQVESTLFDRDDENFDNRGIVGELFQNRGLPHFPTYEEEYLDALGMSDEVYDFSEFRLWSDENAEKVEEIERIE